MLTRAWKAQDDDEQPERPGEEVARDAVEEVEVERAEGDVHERGAAVVDRGGDRDEADEVEPAGEPAPRRAAELGRPPVDAAGRRVGRDELGHAEADDQDRDRDQRPAPGDRDRAAVVPRLAVGREAPGQDRDDRERDREVLKAAPAAVELLLVAQLGEPLLVGVVDAGAACVVAIRTPPKGLAVDPLAKRPYAASRTEVNRRMVRCRYDRWSESAVGSRTNGVYGPRRPGSTDGRYGGAAAGAAGHVEETARRARDEMHAVTASLRALLQDLRDEAEPPPTGARSPGSAPNP